MHIYIISNLSVYVLYTWYLFPCNYRVILFDERTFLFSRLVYTKFRLEYQYPFISGSFLIMLLSFALRYPLKLEPTPRANLTDL